uniref:Restriction endonuclease n=1 Tax=Marseillevirus sp. TaxID=2809551 RepID=A0AA96ES24_9VIRU|nr:restriction endonuclease [Marseillevirus sp.]
MNCETRTRGRLCGEEGCKHCFKRSFASCDKAKYLAEGQENPLLLAKNSHKKFSFICGECGHSFETRVGDVSNGKFCPFCSNKQLCSSSDCEICFGKSFASSNKAEFWSSEKNKKNPREVFLKTAKKFWFECGVCSHLFDMSLLNASNDRFCPFCSNTKLCSSPECRTCFEKSFASSDKAKFWSVEKNKQNPREVFLNSKKKFWFECEKCRHSFEASLGHVSKGQFCPFCSNNKLCSSPKCKICFEKSFASHKKSEEWDVTKNKQQPREVFPNSNKKFWFVCKNCDHAFSVCLYSLREKNCPFCSEANGKLCRDMDCTFCFSRSFSSHKKSQFWSLSNEESPRSIRKFSDKMCTFVCEKGHSFSSKLNNISNGQWCPKCKNKTETKLFSFLEEHFKDPIRQFKVSWCKNPETDKFLPFDFCVSKTIIELDGAQHYKQISNWQSPELTQKSDRYKEEQANKNGYSVLRILQEDVWNDKIDWKSLLLEHIKDYETPIVKNLWEIIEEQQE